MGIIEPKGVGGRMLLFVRTGLSEGEPSESQATQTWDGGVEEGSRWSTASTKALRWNCTWPARETPRRPVCLAEGGHKKG